MNITSMQIPNISIDNLAQHYVGSKVMLNTGEIGEIVFISPQNISTPIVKSGTKYYDLYHDKRYKIAEMF